MSGYDPQQAASWGPRHNPVLFGHAAAEQTLLDAWASGRLPHAWMITGARTSAGTASSRATSVRRR